MKRLLAAAAAISIALSASAAESIPTPSSLIKHNGKAIAICEAVGSTNCKTIPLPKSVGKVKRVIQGNFVSPSGAISSWLALTDKHASVCYLPDTNSRVTCAPVAGETPKDVSISFRDNGENMPTIVFKPKTNTTVAQEEINRAVRSFVRALEPAARRAQIHARKSYQAKLNKFGDRSTYVSPMAQVAVDGSWCDYAAEWSCTGMRSEGYGGGDGGGWWDFGYDNSSWESNEEYGSSYDSSTNDEWFYPAEPVPPPPDTSTYYPDYETILDSPPEPYYPEDLVTVSGTTTCVYGPVIICTAPKPVPFYDPNADITIPEPVRPWTLCNTFGIFCSESDTRDGGFRGGRTGPGDMTEAEREAECQLQYEFDIAECDAYKKSSDYRSYNACTGKAMTRFSACLTTSRDLGRRSK